MKYWDIIIMAVSAIARNKIRAFLTALGIIFGVASIIAIVQIGQATTQNVTQQISAIGSNLLIVQPWRGGWGRGGKYKPFDYSDIEAIQNEIPNITVAPVTGTSVNLVHRNRNHSARVQGSTNEFLEVRNRQVVAGRAFSADELASGAAVCIIGDTIIEVLFGLEDPLGSVIRVNKIACQVIGVLDTKGQSMGGESDDDFVLMPYRAVQRRLLGSRDISMMYVSATQDGSTDQVKRELEALLRQRRATSAGSDDFRVQDMQEIIDTLQGVTKALTALLGIVAAVSLLVGGIGIMNIMLVSVTERTREIGLRLAIGATASDVLTQFLFEAIAVSSLGGFAGILLGVGGSWFAVQAMEMPFVFSPWVAVIGFSFSAVIGVIFGYLPARKAARLNPIQALRHE